MLDNRSAWDAGGYRTIEAAGANGLNSPYLSDFSPLEQRFAKVKSLPRKAAERPVEHFPALSGRKYILEIFR